MTLGPFSPEHHVDTSGALHTGLNGKGVVTSPRESRRNEELVDSVSRSTPKAKRYGWADCLLIVYSKVFSFLFTS